MAAEVDSDPVEELRERLRRHPADRRPLQHATAQFHLGGLLLDRGALGEAESAYATAAALFGARGAHPEEGKALNGLGATLRTAGRLGPAARAFRHAAVRLATARLELEEGAAYFNLGLVSRESGDLEGSIAALERAVELLDPEQAPAQASAAARELGTAQLELGRVHDAETTLARAVALAERAWDEAARAAAANALGLARLAAGRPEQAAEAFVLAVHASPRGVRPEAFAIGKANLALAYEQDGRYARARLAAAQALAAPAVPAAVEGHANGVLERLGGHSPDDLRLVLEDAESDEERARLVREELVRSAEAADVVRAADARAWLKSHTASRLEPVAVAELWLGGLLELPVEPLERLVRSALENLGYLDPDARTAFREAIVRAMARFHVPQMMRLEDVFAHEAQAVGDPGPWR